MDHHLLLLPPNSTYLHQQKSMDESSLSHSLLLAMELQQTKLRAEQDLKSRDDQILHLKELLAAAIKDRDEARQTLKNALLHNNISLHHHHHHLKQDSGISSIEYDPTRGIDGFSSSDCDESIASSPQRLPVEIKGPLPEKGQLLQAVMRAGPLLQTLLLAGPLPQWRHPPPPVDPCQIPPPPLVIPPSPHLPPQFLYQKGNTNINTSSENWPGRTGRKRGRLNDYDWSNESEHQMAEFLR